VLTAIYGASSVSCDYGIFSCGYDGSMPELMAKLQDQINIITSFLDEIKDQNKCWTCWLVWISVLSIPPQSHRSQLHVGMPDEQFFLLMNIYLILMEIING